jgi:glucosamine--fructose-6-phosphate aminotransferase (isomerizing)
MERHMTSGFERDIQDQATALRDFDHAPYSGLLSIVLRCSYQRVVLTGMGSSHYAALPSWRRLTAAGRAVWWLDSGQLLDSPQLITDETLLIATSQSGASGEVVAVLDLLDQTHLGCTVVGITNEAESRLATAADCTLQLRSGPEATVSTKSYLNALAAHDLVASILLDTDSLEIGETVGLVEHLGLPSSMAEAVSAYIDTHDARLAFVGYQDHAATAMYAGLITKEAAKIPAEGYIGGEFRHGPFELAGPGLTAVVFGGHHAAENTSLIRLTGDLVASGSTVLVVGAAGVPGTCDIDVPDMHVNAQLSHGAVLAQRFAVALARAKGITPGTFEFGSKITTAL